MSTPLTVVGNLTADPELRFTASGKAIATLRVAVNSRKKSKEGTWEDGDPTFWKVKVWGDLAEHAADSLTKGTRVIATGRVEANNWETQEGEKRTDYELTADAIGPDLAWATVKITKTGKGSSPRRAVEDDPWAAGMKGLDDLAEVPF